MVKTITETQFWFWNHKTRSIWFGLTICPALIVYVCSHIADSVIPSQTNQSGAMTSVTRDVTNEEGALPTPMYDVDANVSGTADNATYCRGVQPITIEPMDCNSDSNDVEPMPYAQSLPSDAVSSSTPVAARQATSGVPRRPVAGTVPPPAMRVVYCGTVSSDQLIQQNLIGSASASDVQPLEMRNRNLSDSSHGGTTEQPVSTVCAPSGTGIADSGTADVSSRMPVSVQRRNSDRTASSGLSTSRKGPKSRRGQSLDGGETSTSRRRWVRCLHVLHSSVFTSLQEAGL